MRTYKLAGISLWLAFALSMALLLVSFMFAQGATSARAEEEPTMEGR